MTPDELRKRARFYGGHEGLFLVAHEMDAAADAWKAERFKSWQKDEWIVQLKARIEELERRLEEAERSAITPVAAALMESVAIGAFVARVNARAEQEIAKTYRIEGAHYRAMLAEYAALAKEEAP